MSNRILVEHRIAGREEAALAVARHVLGEHLDITAALASREHAAPRDLLGLQRQEVDPAPLLGGQVLLEVLLVLGLSLERVLGEGEPRGEDLDPAVADDQVAIGVPFLALAVG